MLFYEWLLELVKRYGIYGVLVFKVIVGYGCYGVLYEQSFFEQVGDCIIFVELIVDDMDVGKMLDIVYEDGVFLFWVKFFVEFGVVSY